MRTGANGAQAQRDACARRRQLPLVEREVPPRTVSFDKAAQTGAMLGQEGWGTRIVAKRRAKYQGRERIVDDLASDNTIDNRALQGAKQLRLATISGPSGND
ncbi:hypothetical protein AUC68_04730 [Methyloceanibacter methanicus]|uniref:Uncharacterized protein n=1 Tax=Methyloceanibacter methanicus TaxID=1774968 RepID=A0A1E3W0L8_9HYPH|nr:hypothetical protein AUC68_04730 [Methyloceanibacter methanicus]